ncbi:MAG TPA: hypothetical protein VL221_04970 [Bacteroidota bacterium]|nr:hypothetical protein [Bacteroidota bacterium]
MGMILLFVFLLIAGPYNQPAQEKIVIQDVIVPDSARADISPKVDTQRIARNWRKLRKGMSYREVKSLMGSPNGIACSVYDFSTTLHYGGYYIVFDNIKNSVRWWSPKE